MKSKLLALLGAGMIMSPTEMLIPPAPNQVTLQQPLIAESYAITNPYGSKRRKGLLKYTPRSGGAFIVRNQRQKRKAWRQSPHKRPVRNIH